MKMSASDVRRVSSVDGAIVLHLRRGTMFRISPAGSRILDMLEQGISPRRIAEQLSAEGSVPLDIVQADLKDFLQRLEIHGVIDSREDFSSKRG